MKDNYTPYKRNTETGVRYWALPGQEGYMHILGGLEKTVIQVLFLPSLKTII